MIRNGWQVSHSPNVALFSRLKQCLIFTKSLCFLFFINSMSMGCDKKWMASKSQPPCNPEGLTINCPYQWQTVCYWSEHQYYNTGTLYIAINALSAERKNSCKRRNDKTQIFLTFSAQENNASLGWYRTAIFILQKLMWQAFYVTRSSCDMITTLTFDFREPVVLK